MTVSKGADSVDFALVNRVEPGDIAVTQDYGLAAMCLAKRALPLSQDGLLYTEENIGTLLQSRYAAQKIRRSGGRLKGPKKRTSEQDAAFERTLRRLLQLRWGRLTSMPSVESRANCWPSLIFGSLSFS